MSNANEPALPDGAQTIGGLTKREHLAGLMMQGLLASVPAASHASPTVDYDALATLAVSCADKLLKALK